MQSVWPMQESMEKEMVIRGAKIALVEAMGMNRSSHQYESSSSRLHQLTEFMESIIV